MDFDGFGAFCPAARWRLIVLTFAKITLAILPDCGYIPCHMETQLQDTHPQDPIERFALHVEGLRRMPVPRGVAGIVHRLFVEFFIGLWTALAIFAEQRRNGTLAKVVPVEAPVPGPSRAWPEGLKPRESGWVEQRSAEAALGGGAMHAPIAEAPAALPRPPQARVRKLKISSGPALARPRHEDDGCWARWRGPGIVWPADVGFLGFDSKKWALAGADTCVPFVTY